jgi:hypothetical protein
MSRRAIGLLPEWFMDQRASSRWSKFIAVGGDLNPRYVSMFDEKNRPHQTDRGAALVLSREPARAGIAPVAPATGDGGAPLHERLTQIICVEALSFLTCRR